MALKDGKFGVVEYSEISEEQAQLKTQAGTLAFGSGNICNHFFTLDFVANTCISALENAYHVAHKKIPFANEQGETETPLKNNGIKLEMFIFDTFALAPDMAFLDVERGGEFAPVKNASGKDSAESARTMMSSLHKRWLLQAGATLKPASMHEEVCEVCPSVSLRGEGLDDVVGETTLQLPLLMRARTPSDVHRIELNVRLSVVLDPTEKVNVYEVGQGTEAVVLSAAQKKSVTEFLASVDVASITPDQAKQVLKSARAMLL